MSAKFSRMATALSPNTENKSSYILSHNDEIVSANSDKLRPPMRKPPIKEILNRRMKEAGVPSAAELSRRAKAKNRPISETGVKAILQGGTKDPQVFTVDAVAAGLDISPLRLFAEILGIDPDDPSLKADDWRVLWETYRDLTPSQQQKANPHVGGLLTIMRNIRNSMRQ